MGMRTVFPGSATGAAGETLSPDELAYHRRVIGQLKAAQAAAQSWVEHLHVQHGLRPGVDQLHEDGRIERRPDPEPSVGDSMPAANGLGGHGTWGPGEGPNNDGT